MRTTEKKMTLSCTLTKEEWDDASRRLASALTDLSTAEDDLKSTSAEIGGRIKTLKADITSLRKKVQSGEENRLVTVTVINDFSEGTITEIRSDTNEVLIHRKMTEDESQTELDLVPGGCA